MKWHNEPYVCKKNQMHSSHSKFQHKIKCNCYFTQTFYLLQKHRSDVEIYGILGITEIEFISKFYVSSADARNDC